MKNVIRLTKTFGLLVGLMSMTATTVFAGTTSHKLLIRCQAEEIPQGIKASIPMVEKADGNLSVSEVVFGSFQSNGLTYELEVSYETKKLKIRPRNKFIRGINNASITVATAEGSPFFSASAGVSRLIGANIPAQSLLGLSLRAGVFDDLDCRLLVVADKK